MKLHLLTRSDGVQEFFGTRAHAVARKLFIIENNKALFTDYKPKKTDFNIDPIDVPTDKAGLLAFLNGQRS